VDLHFPEESANSIQFLFCIFLLISDRLREETSNFILFLFGPACASKTLMKTIVHYSDTKSGHIQTWQGDVRMPTKHPFFAYQISSNLLISSQKGRKFWIWPDPKNECVENRVSLHE
jgi:hypothetical protein